MIIHCRDCGRDKEALIPYKTDRGELCGTCDRNRRLRGGHSFTRNRKPVIAIRERGKRRRAMML